MKNKMNKRGDIPVTILVIGVVLICCLAIFSFFSSTAKIRKSFVGLGVMEELNSQIEEAAFNRSSPEGIFLEKKLAKGILWWKSESILFSAEYKFKP